VHPFGHATSRAGKATWTLFAFYAVGIPVIVVVYVATKDWLATLVVVIVGCALLALSGPATMMLGNWWERRARRRD
jgi:hypothetical protein